ncbi:YqeB family protein [Actinoplanes utahensis]|uniref:Uncharacterized protein n=1 Tax=Actinoplanes utahensis TaxID=1869 RepID=A0A0A6X2U2_ACTUT|nr:hypothetical protein [Actinoplanes utahensis]KHD74427.1 hypothetical protein MB27_28815 [Actinoplanes utahensis]GIF34379.1 hypothetical protein Aut01nite_73650 [Actinoplanes utahensis]
MSGGTTERTPTVLTFSPAGRVIVLLGPAALGILLAVLLPVLARWLVDKRFPVFGVVWRLASSVDAWWEVAVQAVILAVLGALASVEMVRRSARVTIAPGEVRLQTGDDVITVPRTRIDFVFLHGDRLVILDRESRHLFHGEPQADGGPLEQTFREYGYPWRDGDPFTELYQPWVPGTGLLPVAAEAVLSARAVAVRKKAAREAAELRESLEKLGYSVRDEGDRQFWRPLVSS